MTTGAITRRIHLPPELADQTREERFIIPDGYCQSLATTEKAVQIYIINHPRSAGWRVCFHPSRNVINNAAKVEVIKRQHPTLGKFLIFRVWRQS
jgi:hypothetical protein